MKPKVALVKDGFLPAGSENVRGRLSGAAIERCKQLAAQGWDIEGYSVSKSTDSTTAPVVEKVKAIDAGIVEIPNEYRAEANWTAHTTEGEIGMRTVCNVCGASLNYCGCLHPKVWVDFDREGVVYFKPRTNSLVPGKRW